MATSEEVARLAGVSRATVSRALNGSARISDNARERVHAAVTALGYEPDVVAQSLVRQRSRVIAVGFFPEANGLPLSHLGQTSLRRFHWAMTCFCLPNHTANLQTITYAVYRHGALPGPSCFMPQRLAFEP